jgi:hypothetical protein
LGAAVTVLAAAATDLVDKQSAVEVQLDDHTQWLTSCDEGGLASGQNFAVIGDELIQFATVAPLGGGRFKLAQLLRGRGGTEWACGDHSVGERFCLLETGTLQPVAMPVWSIGATVDAASGLGTAVSLPFTGESVRPLSPVNLSAEFLAGGSVFLSWTRRSRLGFAWVDGIDVPIGETREQYRIVLASAVNAVEISSDQPSLTVSADTLALLGSGPLSVEVRQIGDFAASRPAQATIITP